MTARPRRATLVPMDSIGFLAHPPITAEVRRSFAEDLAEIGYVMAASRLWAYQQASMAALFDLLRQANSVARLSARQRFVLVTAAASTLGDAYCSLVWGDKLAGAHDEATAAGVLAGVDDGLPDDERALAHWARAVSRDPNATTDADVRRLREAGFDDARIFAITLFVALRLAFSTVNDALGVRPDAALAHTVPAAVRDAVTFGRPPAVEVLR